jgi:hypothetical protein
VNLDVFNPAIFDAERLKNPRLLRTRRWYNYRARDDCKKDDELCGFLGRNWAYFKGASMGAIEERVYAVIQTNNADPSKKKTSFVNEIDFFSKYTETSEEARTQDPPPSPPFFRFLNENRGGYAAQGMSVTDVSKKVAEDWEALGAEGKRPYK